MSFGPSIYDESEETLVCETQIPRSVDTVMQLASSSVWKEDEYSWMFCSLIRDNYSFLIRPYDGKWSKSMVGYGPEDSHFVVELTYNYGIGNYKLGSDFKVRVQKITSIGTLFPRWTDIVKCHTCLLFTPHFHYHTDFYPSLNPHSWIFHF